MINEKRFDSCGVCGSNVKDILNFKDFPFAGKFTKEKCEQPEFIADLSLGMCAKCNHMQVTTIANPEFLYTKGYTYRTSKSFLADSNQKVFLEFINGIYDKESPVVLDIGCNDLSLLNVAKDYAGYRIGVDPIQKDHVDSQNKIEVHRKFIEDVDWNVFQEKPDLIVSRHNIEHIIDTRNYFKLLQENTDDSTLLVFEFPDGEAMIKNLRYDQIFHQHVHYFTLNSFTELLDSYGFKVVDSKYNAKMWGGSWIVAFQKGTESSSTCEIDEKLVGDNYELFKAKNVIIDDYLNKCGTVYGYGAGQMTPVLAYHLPSKLAAIESIIDDDPEKEGAYFDYISAKIIKSSQVDLPTATVFITAVDAAASIIKNIGAGKIILPNIQITQ